jgi:hypothetical protein
LEEAVDLSLGTLRDEWTSGKIKKFVQPSLSPALDVDLFLEIPSVYTVLF